MRGDRRPQRTGALVEPAERGAHAAIDQPQLGHPQQRILAQAGHFMHQREGQAAEDDAQPGAARLPQAPEQHAAELLDVIESMDEADRVLARRVHQLVMAAAPELAPKTWYGMPAYHKNGKNICFFQASGKFKVRYCTFGFDVADEIWRDTDGRGVDMVLNSLNGDFIPKNLEIIE